MTYLIDSSRSAAALPARGADTAIPTWWQGLGAAAENSQIDSNANMIRQAGVSYERSLRAMDYAEILGLEAFIEHHEANGNGFDHIRKPPETLEKAQSEFGVEFTNWAYDAARAAAEQNPEAWAEFDLSDEAAEKAVDERLAAEYRENQEIQSLLTPGGAVGADIAGGMIGATADIRNVPFLLAGGGGSFLRVVGREAGLNALAEGVTMPSRFDMAERLDIQDPDVLQELALAAGAGAVLGGTVEAAGRALTYARDFSFPNRTTRHPAEEEALVQKATEALLGSERPARDAAELLGENPAPLPDFSPDNRDPLIVEGYVPPNRFINDQGEWEDLPDATPLSEEEILKLQQEVESLREQVAAARNEDTDSTKPLAKHLARGHLGPRSGSRGGFTASEREGFQVHPDGSFGQSLRAAGITSKTNPGLYSRLSGRTDFDNLVASEWEAQFPGITDATNSRRDDLNGYLDQEGLLDVLRREAAGDLGWLTTRQRVTELEARLTEAERRLDTGFRSPADDFLEGSTAAGGFYVTKEEYPDVYRDVDRYIDEVFEGIEITQRERNEIHVQLADKGGDVEYLIERMIERDLDYGDLPGDLANEADNPTAASLRAQGGSNPGRPEQNPGTAQGGSKGEGTRFEATEAGQQGVIPGVEEVTMRQRLEAQQRASLVGTAREMDEGLFDLGAQAQADWVSDPTGPAADPIMSQRMADERAAIEAGDDFEFPMQTDNGVKMMRASDLLQEVDDLELASARLDLCGMGPS